MDKHQWDKELYPNSCEMAGICCESLPWKEFEQQCLSGKCECDKGQRVMIDILNQILAELKEPDVKRLG